ncbi:MAG: DUF3566 domain-containing protein [Actinomycetaceae bacterium]|nr:DUF3566 domain-containing protein [Actinomycetaceae bacterium]
MKETHEDGPRQVDLAVARLDPWSVMKMTFLLSFALGIILIFASVILWMLLNGMQVFSSIRNFMDTIDGGGGGMNILVDLMRLPRVLGITTVIAVCNCLLLTAFATVSAFLYNVAASLVGGIRLTLIDE